MRLRGDLVAAATFGLLVGAVAIMSAEGLSREPVPQTAPRSSPAEVERTKVAPDTSRVVLAWAPGGLPAGAAGTVAPSPQIARVTTVVAGMDWMPSRRPGYDIPFEVAAVEPSRFSALVPRGEATAFEGLTPRDIVLAETTARSLRLEIGDRVALRSGRYVVSGIVSDVTTMGYEALLARPAASWTRRDPYLLVEAADGGKVTRLAALVRDRVEALLPPGTRVRVRSEGETPYLRYGDAVLPLLDIKDNFGTFGLRLTDGGSFHPDPVWRRNVVSRRVPLLGRVTCHRALFRQLRGALGELRSEGLAHTVNPGDFGGCWSPRFIGRDPSGQISHHAWGVAIDINAAANAFGTKSDQDDRLVETMERWGFTWGGRWLVPDAMHFEWARFPDRSS